MASKMQIENVYTFLPPNEEPQRFHFEMFQKKHIEEALNLLEKSYNLLNPIYSDLKLSSEDFRSFVKPSLENEQNWDISFVAFDTQNNNKMVGLKLMKDMSTLPKEMPKPSGNEKLDLKEKIDFDLYNPEVSKNYKKGQGFSSCFWAIDPETGRSGLGQEFVAQEMRLLYLKGYYNYINIMYNPVSVKMALRMGGRVTHEVQLDNLELSNGEKPYQKNSFGGKLYCTELDEKFMLTCCGKKRWDLIKAYKQQMDRETLRKIREYKKQQQYIAQPKL